jgi:transcriptional regulator with XRE-family HTH domain
MPLDYSSPSPQLLRNFREFYCYTQAQAAKLAGVSSRSWRRYEQGIRALSPRRWKALKQTAALMAAREKAATQRRERAAKQKVKRHSMAGGAKILAVAQALLDHTAVSRRLGPLSELRRLDRVPLPDA